MLFRYCLVAILIILPQSLIYGKIENRSEITARAITVFNSQLFSFQEETIIDTSDEYATPHHIVLKILAELNPKPHEIFLDVGSGDGRIAIEAAKRYRCHAIGIEIDPQRILLAEKNAEEAGVSDKVKFIQGDFTKINWPNADVGYVYLFSENLENIRNNLLTLDRFASYAHQVPNLPMYSKNNGEFYIWDYNKVFTWWDGKPYWSRPKRNCYCNMCNSVVASLNEQKSYRNR